MRKNGGIEQNKCYHLVIRLAHRAFFLYDEEKDRAVALMRRVEEGVQDSMSYCINRAVSINSDPLAPLRKAGAPSTVRIYPDGGHGYGLRRLGKSTDAWSDEAAAWLAQLKFPL